MGKSISASKTFEKFPEVKKELLGEEFWKDGYFVKMLGNKITTYWVRHYTKYHLDEVYVKQLTLF